MMTSSRRHFVYQVEWRIGIFMAAWRSLYSWINGRKCVAIYGLGCAHGHKSYTTYFEAESFPACSTMNSTLLRIFFHLLLTILHINKNSLEFCKANLQFKNKSGKTRSTLLVNRYVACGSKLQWRKLDYKSDEIPNREFHASKIDNLCLQFAHSFNADQNKIVFSVYNDEN